MESRRRDVRRERLRASALQRRSRQRSDPARVQGEAAVSLHAPALSEDDFLPSDHAAERPRGLDPTNRSLKRIEMTRPDTPLFFLPPVGGRVSESEGGGEVPPQSQSSQSNKRERK